MSKVDQLIALAAKERNIRAEMEAHQDEIERLSKKRAVIVQEMAEYANQYDVAQLLGIHQTRVSRIIRRR